MAGMTTSAIRPSPRRERRAADDRDGAAGGLAEGELGGGGELVGDGADRRVHHAAVGVGRAAQVVERQRPGHADRDVDDAPAPRPAERVGDDHRHVDAEPAADRRADPTRRTRPGRAAAASRSSPSPGPTFEASTPPLAQTKPCGVSVMITPFVHAHDAARLAQHDLDLARDRGPSARRTRPPPVAARRRSGRRSRPRPSRRSSASRRGRRRSVSGSTPAVPLDRVADQSPAGRRRCGSRGCPRARRPRRRRHRRSGRRPARQPTPRRSGAIDSTNTRSSGVSRSTVSGPSSST